MLTTTEGRSTTIDLTSAQGIAVLTLLPDTNVAPLSAALTPAEARALANQLDTFARLHDR